MKKFAFAMLVAMVVMFGMGPREAFAKPVEQNTAAAVHLACDADELAGLYESIIAYAYADADVAILDTTINVYDDTVVVTIVASQDGVVDAETSVLTIDEFNESIEAMKNYMQTVALSDWM